MVLEGCSDRWHLHHAHVSAYMIISGASHCLRCHLRSSVGGQAPVEQQQEVLPPPRPFEEEVGDLTSLEPEQQVHTLAVMR